MSHVRDSDKTRQLEMMHVGVLMRMLFDSAQPTPARLDAHTGSSLVRQEVADFFERLHLAVRWLGRNNGMRFDNVKIHPSTEDTGALRVHVIGREWGEGAMRQIYHGLDVVGCYDRVVERGDDDAHSALIFTLPAEVVTRLYGSQRVLQP